MKTTNKELGEAGISENLYYTDVPKDAWFSPFVQKATELKIISGYSDKTFRPLEKIKLVEAAKITINAFRFPVSSSKTDVWWEPYLAFISQKNLFEPNPKNNKLNHEKFLTRAEFAGLVFRALKVKEAGGKAFDETIEWKTFQNENNFYELRYPAEWEIFRGTNHSVVWKRDTKNSQVWFTRIFPLSMRASLSFQETGKCVPKQEENKLKRTFDLIVCHGKGKTLFVYGDYGTGLNPIYAKEILKTITGTIRYIEPKPKGPPPLTPEQKLEKAREFILIEGRGPEILKLFEDKKLVHTDAIGVGTGPVDYFYSKGANATIKHERNSKTILDVREGETVKF